jgi:hypothetical protein
MAEYTIEQMKDKIAKLLAKAEGTSNEAEQRAFTEKAEQLMIRLGIDAAELEAAGTVKPEDIVEVQRVWTTIYAPAMGQFTYLVGMAYGNLTFLQGRAGKDFVRSYIIGHKSDVEQFEVLLTSLHLQVMSALKQFRKDNREERRYYTIHQNFITDRSFIEGYAAAVARRLREMRRVEESTASEGAALVLVSKKERVEDWKDNRYPDARKGRESTRQQSWRGRSAGAAAGQQASLGGKAVSGRGVLS